MFQWDKTIKTLDVPVGEVLHLFRSMRDVQLALPGLPAQEARAYLCQYRTGQGIGTATVFHLHKSGQLAFYVNTPREVPAEKADSMLDQALVFVESMGFLMTDLDLHLLAESDREMLWSSLPLQQGLQIAEKDSPAKPAAVQQLSAQPKATVVAPVQESPVPAAKPPFSVLPTEVKAAAGGGTDRSRQEKTTVEENANDQTNVDDLLAAVEELRTRRPGVRARKKPPSPEELKRRRQELRENLGHILASL